MVETYTVQVHAKRLVTARWTAFHSVKEAETFRAAILQGVGACEKRAVICADWRAAHVVSPEITQVLFAMLQGVHPHIERSAILLAEGHAVFNLQAERMVRDAAAPNRRTFRSSTLMLNWLTELLGSDLQAVAESFLMAGEVNHKP